MREAHRFTKLDAAVLLLSILLLLNLAAVGQSGRRRARQAVCLSNLGQMTSAWLAYAGDNDGELVSADAGITTTYGGGRVKKPWVGECWDHPFNDDTSLPEKVQRAAIRDGVLWPYVGETRLYGCPDGYPGQMLTCGIVDSMNGMTRAGTSVGGLGPDASGVRIGDTVLWIKNLAEIISPGPDRRMVFIDQGWALPGTYSVHYIREAWWTEAPVRHWDGTSVSFADGHAEHWRWQGGETILKGREHGLGDAFPTYTFSTPEDKEDLHRLQTAVWGRLGY